MLSWKTEHRFISKALEYALVYAYEYDYETHHWLPQILWIHHAHPYILLILTVGND